jgi:alpha-methylacyl-CoA racemase
MIDGTAQLMWMMHSMHAAGSWNAEERGVNLVDGAAPFYDTYETSDHKYVAIGAIEPQFYARFIKLIGADPVFFGGQVDSGRWPELKAKLSVIFKSKTRDEWCRILEGSDACFAPVLTLSEAPDHPHNRARHSYFQLNGQVQPSPAPRFSRTRPEVSHGARPPGTGGERILLGARFSAEEIAQLNEKGAFIPAAQISP